MGHLYHDIMVMLNNQRVYLMIGLYPIYIHIRHNLVMTEDPRTGVKSDFFQVPTWDQVTKYWEFQIGICPRKINRKIFQIHQTHLGKL